MYYSGNELYRYLVEHDLTDRYFWVSGDMWSIMYSDVNGLPLLLCFVCRVDSDEELDRAVTREEAQVFSRLRCLADKTGLPLISLRFAETCEHPCETFRFKVYGEGAPSKRISSAELLNRLKELGLPVQAAVASKQVNDKASSAFHLWQRTHFGNRLIATDLDLIRFCGDAVDTLYELKRSHTKLDKWEPYPEDRFNYRAGAHFARLLGANYRVVYNVRHTRPEYFDDISHLKIYDMSQGWPGKCLGQFAVEDYFK